MLGKLPQPIQPVHVIRILVVIIVLLAFLAGYYHSAWQVEKQKNESLQTPIELSV